MNPLIKIFPEYEEVFYDDIENHKKYFLPICSFNLKLIDTTKDTWLHIVSVKEIYDGRVGEDTTDYHTTFTKADMFGFDVIDGKYKFDADWNYFSVDTVITAEDYAQDYSGLEIEYNKNETIYQLKKAYYQKYGKLCDKDYDRPGLHVEDIRSLERMRQLTVEDMDNGKHSDYYIERLERKIYGLFEELNTAGLPLEDCKYGGENITEKPCHNGEVLPHIATIEGYDFQQSAADMLFLFYDPTINKAVICLEYT
ncbi:MULTISPECIES: hypothetical protein [Myroides]|uniref:Siderophore biosynthesis protein n=1 Tax=Myroides albus TaxID=2562892 RepID=A0A6I3LK74_9FLAO|nr:MULTISPECIES: hypothetical protein [Myroides]MTG98214.1 hypothetical protein [Myroides albus]MVX36356.1 hypothetical protein [Myroides sp. LoEW2-1]UVD79333.1 hypothetical protein NWE55_14545 [Myroides albus]